MDSKLTKINAHLRKFGSSNLNDDLDGKFEISKRDAALMGLR